MRSILVLPHQFTTSFFCKAQESHWHDTMKYFDYDWFHTFPIFELAGQKLIKTLCHVDVMFLWYITGNKTPFIVIIAKNQRQTFRWFRMKLRNCILTWIQRNYYGNVQLISAIPHLGCAGYSRLIEKKIVFFKCKWETLHQLNKW